MMSPIVTFNLSFKEISCHFSKICDTLTFAAMSCRATISENLLECREISLKLKINVTTELIMVDYTCLDPF